MSFAPMLSLFVCILLFIGITVMRANVVAE